MLRETQNQLKICKIKMNISFILLTDQQNAYDAFVQRLNEMQTIDLTVSHKIPPKKKDDQSTITYDSKSKIFLFLNFNFFFFFLLPI